MPNPSGVVASSDTNPAPAGHELTRNVPAYCAPPFRPQRPICPQCPLVLARATMSRSSRLCEGIRGKPFSCFFVSGEAPLSCPEASATSRKLKRRGEAVSQMRREFVVARQRNKRRGVCPPCLRNPYSLFPLPCSLSLALTRDHEPWPGGESRAARLAAARPIPVRSPHAKLPHVD